MTETLLGETNTPAIDPNKDYLNELVGEGKKFKTPQDLAKGKYESDAFIETLKRQQDELRADYLKLREEATARAKLEELIGQLEAKQQPASNTQPQVTEVKDKPATIDPKEIETLVSSKIQEIETSKKEQENFNIVKNKLIEKFGPNYQASLKQQIEELGLSEGDLNALARKSPNAFIRTLGLDQQVAQETFQAPVQSSLRSDSFKPTGSQKKTWSYWQNMKKNDPKTYYNPKTNVEIHNAMLELGDVFKDGDYHKYGD